jgi:hypothetical protein
MKAILTACVLLLVQLPPKPIGPPERQPESHGPLDRSAYFAFVDRDYIFTIEMVKPGVPLFNFISMTDKEQLLPAKDVRLSLEGRKATGKLFVVDTGDPKEPVVMPSIHLHPKSSFGVRLQGDFGDTKEVLGVAVRFGPDDFFLMPLTSSEFESLALKINRLNLGSPDLREDWRVLKLETIGTRAPSPRRRSFDDR